MSSPIRIARRFCGPPDSGNGGYSSGTLASLLPGACECTLRKPIPLERELQTEVSDRSARLLDGAELIIEAVQTTIDIADHAATPFDQAHRASSTSPAFINHPFPTCFTCGPERKAGDGLRIFPGRLPPANADGVVFAAPWIPDSSLTSGGVVVRPEFVWAAMDCPTGFAAGFPWKGTLVTGRLAVEQLAPVYPDRPYVVMSWSTGSEGRKHHAGAALYDSSAQICAKARATWIKLE
ncbi:MAG TPA: hypothetical protein VNX88_17135 [Terriglobales bacterium]|jgi:hypothetical protein|nr:hypothetical protein [Terriglobales bacterium]